MSDDGNIPVKDKLAENGIKWGNIMTAIIIGLMSWVAFNINHIKDLVADALKNIAIIKVENGHTREDVRDLKSWAKEHEEAHKEMISYKEKK